MASKRKHYITLSDGTRARVDYRDRWARNFRWYPLKGYARRMDRSAGRGPLEVTRLLHREIYARILGRKVPKHLVIDHIDRNRRNNTRSNLRLVSSKTNNWNRTNVLLWDGERWVYEPHGRIGLL